MEDFRGFLLRNPDMISNANACSRAFGAPSKCTAAVSSFAHYNEIFGNFFTTKSSPVPILDYPLLDDDQAIPGDPGNGFDYAGIFGSGHAGDYDDSFEQVGAESNVPECCPTKFSSQDVKGGRPQELFASSKKCHAQSIVDFPHMCNEAKVTRDFSQDSAGAVVEVDHIEGTVSRSQLEKSHKNFQADYILHDYKLGNPKNATVHNHSIPNSFANHSLQSDFKENSDGVSNATDCDPTVGSDQNSSVNPFIDLASGKDTSSHVSVFLSVTDIDLHTEPSALPPPLRPPPKLGSPLQVKGSQYERNQVKPLISTDGETHAIEVTYKRESSPLIHVEEDLGSTADPSVDAIREAMDKAKAKLKSAKESLERTRADYRDCMKFGLCEDIKINAKKESGSAHESLVLKDDEAQEGCHIRTNEVKELRRKERPDVIGIGFMAPHYEENMGLIELRKESLCKFQEEACRSLNTHKLEHGTTETNTNKKSYELVNNEELLEGILKWNNDGTNSGPSGRVLLHKQKTAEAIQEENVIDLNEKNRLIDETNEQVHISISKEHKGAWTCKEGNTEKTQESGQMEKEKKKVAAEAPEQDEEIEWNSVVVAHRHIYDGKRLKAARKHDEKNRPEADSQHSENGPTLNVTDENKDLNNCLKTAIKHEEVEKLKAACDHIEEKRLIVTQKHKEDEGRLKAAPDPYPQSKRLKATCMRTTKEEKRLNSDYEFERENEIMKAAQEHEEVETRLKASLGNPWEEKGETPTHLPEMGARLTDDHVLEENNSEAANKGVGSEEYGAKVVPHEWIEIETKLRSVLEAHINEEHEKNEAATQVEERDELDEMLEQGHTHYVTKESIGLQNRNEKLKEIQDTYKIHNAHNIEGNKHAIDKSWKVYEGSDIGVRNEEAKVVKSLVQEVEILKQTHRAYEYEATENKTNTAKNEEICEKLNAAQKVLSQDSGKSKELFDCSGWEYEEKEQRTAQTVQEPERNENELKAVKEAFDVTVNEKCPNECLVAHDMEESNNIEQSKEKVKEAEAGIEKVAELDSYLSSRDKSFRTAQQVTTGQHREREDKAANKVVEKEKEKEERMQREREREKERLRKIEEEIKREREREKNRIALERTRVEASARVLVETQEKPEKASMDRVTTEAQTGHAEARERAEEASLDDARLRAERAEKASLDVARLRAERAAVERAVAEARQRAAKKLMAQRTAATYRIDATYKADGEPQKTSDFHGAEGQSSLRCRARLERHQRIVERAAKALAEKNVRDILAQRELAERNRLSETLDAEVRRWSNGKEGNLRALLSTLQYVLGPESGWQPISLNDVLTAAAVKRAYRKATLCVHPDKLQQRGASIQKKYICEKVFDLLKDAWNKFNSEER
ncbi:hypothetical protein H6P81_005025 [Aristolochia fimbriata]|uniref:J domain-containing protein n=1 Tax=Aristolochia fimbriata TaxID=158543 RepID=A0AAV7EUG6_ARIFI|nr:hypothetical protein H6P81_005025 [Aristolochia fimbriata]